jgi:hypothetical protein
MNTKVEDNFMAHNLDTKICIIWSPDVGHVASAMKGCESGKSGRD